MMMRAPSEKKKSNALPRVPLRSNTSMFACFLFVSLSWIRNPEQHAVSQTTNIPHLFLNGLKVIIAPTEETVLKLRVSFCGV